jgi:hypothetical protein
MGAFGYLMEKDDYNPDKDLKKIGKSPNKFKTGIGLALIEHACVIALTILLFIAFSPYGLLLGIVLLIFRMGEGLIQFYNEPFYWKLIDIARKYSSASDTEKKSLSDSANKIFKGKDTRFKYAMICWSIGTIAFSIILVNSGFVPLFIGWLGIIAGILVGVYTGIRIVKPNSKIPPIGAIFAILFEIIIGGWLIYYSII